MAGDAFDLNDYIRTPEAGSGASSPELSHKLANEGFWSDVNHGFLNSAGLGLGEIRALPAGSGLEQLTSAKYFGRVGLGFVGITFGEKAVDGLVFDEKPQGLIADGVDYFGVPALLALAPTPLWARIGLGIGAHLIGRVADEFVNDLLGNHDASEM